MNLKCHELPRAVFYHFNPISVHIEERDLILYKTIQICIVNEIRRDLETIYKLNLHPYFHILYLVKYKLFENS